MNRTAYAYILATLAFVAGLWVVLRYGATLHAPADLSGQWRIEWRPFVGPDVGPHLPERMIVEQSGLYVDARLMDEHEVHLRGRAKPIADQGPGAFSLTLASDDGKWKLVIPYYAGKELAGELRTPDHRAWTARRGARRDAEPAVPVPPASRPTDEGSHGRD